MFVEVKQLLDNPSLTGEEVAMMEAWKKQEADFYDITAGYFERGKKQGMKQGRIQEKSELIMTMAKTMMPESIAAALEMPVPTVLTIFNKNKS